MLLRRHMKDHIVLVALIAVTSSLSVTAAELVCSEFHETGSASFSLRKSETQAGKYDLVLETTEKGLPTVAAQEFDLKDFQCTMVKDKPYATYCRDDATVVRVYTEQKKDAKGQRVLEVEVTGRESYEDGEESVETFQFPMNSCAAVEADDRAEVAF